MKLSNLVADYRKNSADTLEQLAEKTDLSKGFLSRIEKGDFDSRNVSLATIIKLAKGFNVKVKEILDMLKVIDAEQDDHAPLKVYLRKKYNISNDEDVRIIEGMIDRLK